MNKSIFYALFLLLTASLVLAAGQGTSGGASPTTDSGAVVETGPGENAPVVTGQPEETGPATDVGNGSQQAVAVTTQLRNSGENAQNQVGAQISTLAKSGEYTSEDGKKILLQVQENNKIELKSGEATAKTSMKMNQEQTATGTKLNVELSNGKNAEVKVMPDTASAKALERIGLKVCTAEEGCSIELKEVGFGETAQPAYEVEATTEGKFLGLFKVKAKVKTQVSAENGEILRVKKPFLTSVKTVETQ